MTLSQQAPSLVERLNGLLVEEDRMHPLGCATWLEEACVAIEEAAAKITELEGQLRSEDAAQDAAETDRAIWHEIADNRLARAERAEADVAALTKALTGLTCGGSEFFVRRGDGFVADVDACVAWVRRSKEDAHRRTLEAIQARQCAEAQCRVLLEALGEIAQGITGPEKEGHYLAHRKCVAIARQALSHDDQRSDGGRG